MSDWQPIATAPRDGTEFLALRENGCWWEAHVVGWSGVDKAYPWESDGNAYPEGWFDLWCKIDYPSGSSDTEIERLTSERLDRARAIIADAQALNWWRGKER